MLIAQTRLLQRDIDIGLNADCRAYAKEMGLQIKGTQDDVVTVERKTKTHIWTIEFSIDAEAKEPIQEQGKNHNN